MLVVDGNSVFPPQIENKGQWVDVERPGYRDGEEGRNDEGKDKLVMSKCEHRDSDI